MAEAALKAELKKRKIRWYYVGSAGLSAHEGQPMSAFARQALSEAGIPYPAEQTSKRLTEKLLSEAHAVVCMTESQRVSLGERQNVTSFYNLCGREIPDPYGQGIEVYRATLQAILECLPALIQLYCAPVEGV